MASLTISTLLRRVPGPGRTAQKPLVEDSAGLVHNSSALNWLQNVILVAGAPTESRRMCDIPRL